jgi:PQQ-dependent catabolism-associated CXXCW motif protein
LFDVLGGDVHQSLPGAIWLPGAGRGQSFTDTIQARFAQALEAAAKGDRKRVLVFFCQGPECWLSYNAALRAVRLGYETVYWYRGGIEAWIAAGGDLAPMKLTWRNPPE